MYISPLQVFAGDKASKSYFARAIDVDTRMAGFLIHVLKLYRPNVTCIVAPYEADAQLSYLSINNIVDCIISEDSDTIPYGCKNVIFKLDWQGNCKQLHIQKLFGTRISGFDLTVFTPEMLIAMCVAAGCDYLVGDF